MRAKEILTYRLYKTIPLIGLGLFLILLNVLSVSTANAQFVNFTFELETEFSASTEEDLNFGTLPVQSGINRIGLGDQGMGVVMFRGIRYQRLYITVDEPDQLLHSDSDNNSAIPIDLNFAYNNRGEDNPDGSTELDEYGTSLTLLGQGVDFSEAEGLNEYLQSEWANMYIYVYGSVEVGNVSPGVYKNQVTVSIEY